MWVSAFSLKLRNYYFKLRKPEVSPSQESAGAVYYPNNVMTEDWNQDDAMEIQGSESSSPLSTAPDSPVYSLLEREECVDEDEEMESPHDEMEEDDGVARRKAEKEPNRSSSEEEDDNEGASAARRKAKGKSKASPPPPEEENDADDEQPVQPPRAAKLNPLALHPTVPAAAAAKDATTTTKRTDADSHTHSRGLHFADADAAMNEAFYSSSPSSSPLCTNQKENETKNPNTKSEHRGTAFSTTKLIDKLFALQQHQQQQQQQRDSGSKERQVAGGEGAVGWGLEWHATTTQKNLARDGGGGSSVQKPNPPHPTPASAQSPAGQLWEVYDASAWERATATAPVQEPPRDGSAQRTMVQKKKKEKKDLVRATRPYRAILQGTYLNYAAGDVMEVVFRDPGGWSLFFFFTFVLSNNSLHEISIRGRQKTQKKKQITHV